MIDLGSVFWLSLIGPEFKAKIKEVDCLGPVAADAMGQRSGYRPFVYSVFQDAHLGKIHSLPFISLAKETQLYTVYYRQRYNNAIIDICARCRGDIGWGRRIFMGRIKPMPVELAD